MKIFDRTRDVLRRHRSTLEQLGMAAVMAYGAFDADGSSRVICACIMLYFIFRACDAFEENRE